MGILYKVIVSEFAASAELRRIRISTSTDDSIVAGDEDALAIALRNLLKNALRFARARIVLDVEHVHDRVTITVQDDGPRIH